MNKAMWLMLLVCGAFVGMGMIPSKEVLKAKEEHRKPYELADIKPPKQVIIPKEKPKELVEPPKKKAMVKNTPPVIIKDVDVKEEPVVVDSVLAIDTGPKTQEGSSVGSAEGNTTGVANKPTEPAKQIVHDWVAKMPQFIGDIYAYIGSELRYPRMAVENHVSGKVLISFVISETGDVENAAIVRGIGSGCDEEALRVVKNMPKWKPGIHTVHL